MADRTINGDLDGNGRSDALDKMEAAAKNVYLDALNEDALVGIYEFHRGDRDPQKVADFSTDKNYLKGRIDAIWTEYVQNFPAESRCWDALYAAVGEFNVDPEARRDEQRAIVFLSDGRDESSTHTYQDAIDAARRQGIAFYCIGFGAELDMGALRVMTSQTGGKYYSATTVDVLATQFAQIINDLGGQYILRWATLKRTSQTFLPSFTLHISGHDLRYASAPLYRPTDHAGNPLEGTLRMVSSDSATQSIAYLRAAYIPRYITALSLYVESDYPFTASLVEAGAGGLCDPAAWTLTQTPEGIGMRIVIESTAPDDIFTALPFGAFGPILKFEFGQLVDPTVQFTTLAIDNTLYSGGQTFVFLAE
jgi:hypothetical protein